MWKMLVTFFSKALEVLIESAHCHVMGIRDFECTLETLKRKMESLRAKALDVEEDIKNAEVSGKKKRKREVETWLNEIRKLENGYIEMTNNVKSPRFLSKFLRGDPIRILIQRIDELVEQSRHFGELLLDVHDFYKGEVLLTRRLVGEEFDKNLKRIWDFLVGNEVVTIGIYGMGGAGKTTLVKHVNNRLVEQNVTCAIWITISQVFSVKNLQGEIARVARLHDDLSDEHNEDKRAARLKKVLSRRKNIVLILDDVWRKINLEKLGDPLSLPGCRLIITTRSLEVCHQIGCQEVVAMTALNTNDAWELFRETLGKGTLLSNPEVQEIARSMVKECSGLPLGIITIAGSMKGETSIYLWRNALTQLKEFVMADEVIEEDEVFKVLKCSFDRLDQRKGENIRYTNLQLCFLYCCLYPEDDEISKKELINKFILEEFLDKRKSRRKQIDEGQGILDKLVNACLLESVGPHVVKMHDLVRAMALRITKGKYYNMDKKQYAFMEF